MALATPVHSYTLGYRSRPGTASATDLLRFGSSIPNTAAAVSIPPTNGFPVSIDGRNYTVDTSFEPYRREAFRHKSIAPQRQSLHFTNLPDDGTVSTEGLWRREARDWSLGAGQIYFDRKASDDARFYRSKGVDPWTQWQLKLLQDTANRYTSSGSISDPLKAIRVGSYVYIQDGNTLKFCSAWGTYTSCAGISGTILDLTTDGYNVWVLTTAGLFVTIAGNNDGCSILFSWALQALVGSSLSGVLNWSNGRLIMAINNARGIGASVLTGSSLYDLSSASSVFLSGAVAKTVGYLSSSCTASDTTLNVDYLTNALLNNALIQIEGEIIKLSAAGTAGNTTLTAVAGRGRSGGTAAASHAAGTPIYSYNSTTAVCPTFSSVTQVNAGWIYTHPNPQWKWNAITGGSSQIYFAGSPNNASDPGFVYRSTVNAGSPGSASSAPAAGYLTSPVVALPLPAGEYPTALRNYINFIFVGTNRGIRMCETLNALDPTGNTGDLKAGPLIPNITQPVSQPITAIVGHDRYVYFSWNNYDTSSTGIGRMDLTKMIDTQAPAYASDLMVTGQGLISWLDWDPITDSPLMSVDFVTVNSSIYTADPNNCVTSGSVDSGLITYGIPDFKNAVSIDVNVENINGSTSSNVSFDLSVDDSSSLNIGSYSGLSPKATLQFPQQEFGEQYRLTTFMSAAVGASGYVSPTLNRWTMKALPGIPSGIMIMAVLLFYEPYEMDGQIVYQDPYVEYQYLEQLRQLQKVITYVEGPWSADVTVDLIDWLPERRRSTMQGGFHGDLVITLKTVSG